MGTSMVGRGTADVRAELRSAPDERAPTTRLPSERDVGGRRTPTTDVEREFGADAGVRLDVCDALLLLLRAGK